MLVLEADGRIRQRRRFDLVAEAEAAARARALGLPHRLRRIGPERLPTLAGPLSALLDEPFANASALPTLQRCRFARKRLVVALAGDGGDGLFGGSRHYADVIRLRRRLRLLPRPLHHLARRALALLERELVTELSRQRPAPSMWRGCGACGGSIARG